ncbi:10774_t:CDS:10 [Entrophospora sp. SA101]|nr:13612_t:CDS:10 [Entrophospora sp. SA101]CAJ0651625.1 10774_t:CDS:10 [Entrophospora sp. SA101]CAJ0832466.1 1615_t:CDS:10 [Entrophospora sp. SA101]CAJ0833455.1 16415_t:CDS:10 [Entrophospora sp. SA101]CAJ0833463.1 16418_t:CDS:10 [Entrophospora sp. SA101]
MTTEQNKDLIGIMLIGTKHAQNRVVKDHIYVLQNIDSLDIHRIKELNEIISGDFDFEEQIGIWDGEFPFGDVFWVCGDIFNLLISPTIKTKRIFLITDCDNPHPMNEYLRSTAITRAKDLIESKIGINIFGINTKAGELFNLDAFYTEILSLNNDITNYSFVSTFKDYKKMASQIKSKEVPRRSTFSIPFRLFEDDSLELTIGIKGYSTIIVKKKPAYKYVHMRSETARIAEMKTEWICSIRTFTALHKKMLELNKIAICFMTRVVGRPPCYVALKPQAEVLDEDGRHVESPGFHLLTLPFAEDIRSHHPNVNISPVLERYYHILKQIALDENSSFEKPDATLPKYSLIDQNVGGLIEEFNKVTRNLESNQINLTSLSLAEPTETSSTSHRANSL